MLHLETIGGMVVVGTQDDQEPSLSRSAYDLQEVLHNAGISTEWRDGEVSAQGHLVISPEDYTKAESLGLLNINPRMS